MIELLSTIIVIGGLVTLVAVFASNPSPDDSVYKAAKSMTINPVVSKGHFAFFGCSNGDTFKYNITTQSGEYVGYVCQGWSPIPGVQKGATPRF